MNIIDYIDSKARIRYGPFVELVKTMRLDQFEKIARHPFLIGKDLYQGKLEEDQYHNTSTMPFHKEELRNMLRPNQVQQGAAAAEPQQEHSTITRALFMLVKKRGSQGMPNEIFIGRSSKGNDIVIADYAVSKTHCKITINRGRYSITDVGSTNGTFFNDHPLKQGVEYELPPDNDIAFGRLVFRFISAKQLYYLLTS